MKVWVLIAAALLSLPASAEIYRCMDASGKVSYSLTPPATPCHARRGAAQARPVAKASPADFPRVDGATQAARDAGRRQILEAELAAEQELHRAANDEAAQRHERNILALRKELSFLR